MSAIKVKVAPPLKKEVYSEKKHGIVSRTQEEAKKSIFIQFTVAGYGYAASRQIADEMMALIRKVAPSASYLSEKTWGKKQQYDPESKMYTDTIVLDRDFDRTKQQQAEILEFCRNSAREIKKSKHRIA